ncbi:T9SS type A sorting domain-containing protein [Candidatus Poribacteria bacterium]|nr:T9SS type A sorting domain-containing protein [Candidatus Poribacteria bacterium]
MKKYQDFLLILFLVQSVMLFFGSCNRLDDEDNDTQEKGKLSGTVRFIGLPCPPEEISGRKPQVPPCDGPYPNYEITVYQADGKTIVSKVASDASGNYKISLNAGTYIIYTQNGLSQANLTTNQVTVVSGQMAKLDLVVDTGIR